MNARMLASLAGLALAGCSLIYDPSKVDEPPQREEVATWVEAWLDAYLAGAATCIVASAEYAETWDMGSRVAYRERMLEFWGTGNRRFDREAAAECLSRVRSPATCDDLLYARYPEPGHPCQRALQGTLQSGEACASTLECSPELYCDGGNGICPGRCAPRGGMGSGCGSSFNGFPSCRRDLQCNGTTCISRHLGVGQGCSTSSLSPCAFGLYCSASSQCAQMVAENGSCATGEQCAYGLYCDGTNCKARGASGVACTAGSCAFGYRCGPAGTCVPQSTLGQACGDPGDGSENRDCIGSRCTGSTCEAVSTKGQAMIVGGCAPYQLAVGAPALGAICSDVCP